MRSVKTPHERHLKLKEMYLEELLRQESNRRDRVKWVRYYENEQFTDEQRAKLAARGQSAVSYNSIKGVIDWLKGTERRGRIDFTVAPRTDSSEAREGAQAKQELMKYLDYANQTGFERSLASDQSFTTGLGWLEVATRQDKQGPKVVSMAEDWRNIVHDSRAINRDGDDARFLFRSKVIDLDVAIALFPSQKQELERVAQRGTGERLMGMWSGASNMIMGDAIASSEGSAAAFAGTDLFSTRDRVMLLEAWTREPARREDRHVGGLTDPVSWEIYCTIMTSEVILARSKSPYNHGRFPFVPIWCYRSLETGLPYCPIRDLIDIQDSLNSRIMRSHFLSHASQLRMEKSAVDNAAMSLEQIEREMRDPNGIAVFADGALSGNRVQETKHAGDVRQLMELAKLDMDSIYRMSGVTPENQESTGNESGKSRTLRADQGSLLTTEIFDNLLRARNIEGVLTLSLCEQYMTAERSIPVAGSGANRKFRKLNVWNGQRFENDVGSEESEFLIGEQAWKQSHASAAHDSLLAVLAQLAGSAPDVVIALLDVVFAMNPNLPEKDKVLARIRSVTGQRDEDAEITPEEKAAKEQQAQVQKAQFEAQMAQLQATIRESQAKGEKLEADAMAKRIEALYMSAQGAQVLSMAPQAAPIADELLRSAGFQDAGAQGPGVIDPAAMPAMQEQQAMPPMDMEQPIPDALQADGGMQGIETPAPDGVI